MLVVAISRRFSRGNGGIVDVVMSFITIFMYVCDKEQKVEKMTERVDITIDDDQKNRV